MKRKSLAIILTMFMAISLFPVTALGNDPALVKVAAGQSHSMALHTDGSLWVWGENTFGQLGNGKTTIYGQHNQIALNHDEYAPIKLMENIADIAAGDGFSLAVNENGELFSWGLNFSGQLGDGTNINRDTPVKIMEDVVFVDARGRVAIAITNDNRLWAWGNDVTNWGWDHFSTPVHIMDNVRTAAAGGGHILMLTHDNRLYGMGDSSNLGIGNRGPNVYIETPVLILPNIRDIVANRQTSFAITLDNRLYGWGPNGFDGSIGSGSDDFWIHTPEFVMDNVHTVFPGNMLLRNDNSLWIWGGLHAAFSFRSTESDGQGADTGGMMMDSIVQYGNRPVLIMNNVLTACGGGHNHFLAIDREFNLFAWGNNQFGELGTGIANVYGFEAVDIMGYGTYDYFPYLTQNNQKEFPTRIGDVFSAGSVLE